jgi:hypothetical protein
MGRPGDDVDRSLVLAAADLERLVRRLRRLTPQAWRPRREPAMALVVALTEIAARAERLPPRPAPRLPNHAVGDAVAVLGADALAALTVRPDRELLRLLAAELQAALDATR